jgi:hypothetical protein
VPVSLSLIQATFQELELMLLRWSDSSIIESPIAAFHWTNLNLIALAGSAVGNSPYFSFRESAILLVPKP